jgi:hypothetical protein
MYDSAVRAAELFPNDKEILDQLGKARRELDLLDKK